MSHERSDRIKLDPTEARCYPSVPCQASSKCLRYLAPLPKTGAIVFDGAAGANQYTLIKPRQIAFCPRQIKP